MQEKTGTYPSSEREAVISCLKFDFKQRNTQDADDRWLQSLLGSLGTQPLLPDEYSYSKCSNIDSFIQTNRCVLTDNNPTFHKSPSAEFHWQSPIRTRKPSNGCLKSPTAQDAPVSPKKQVKFADDLGLSLELSMEHVDIDEEGNHLNFPTPLKYALHPRFEQPGSAVDFLDKVRENKVCLENAMVCEELSVHGTIRVADTGCSKNVKVRFTTNNWQRYYDLPTREQQELNDGHGARFTFRMSAPECFCVGDKLEFAVTYETGNQIYWDNNNRLNYVFECKVDNDSDCFQVSGVSHTANNNTIWSDVRI